MSKKELLTTGKDLRKLYLGGLILLIIGIAVILIIFSGGAHIDAKSSVYDNGVLTTTFSYDADEPHKVWVQYRILRVNSPFSTTEVLGLTSFVETFTKGDNYSRVEKRLDPGEYKIFIYVVDFEDMNKRLAGFIRYIEVI